jgi:hypothetical protein
LEKKHIDEVHRKKMDKVLTGTFSLLENDQEELKSQTFSESYMKFVKMNKTKYERNDPKPGTLRKLIIGRQTEGTKVGMITFKIGYSEETF